MYSSTWPRLFVALLLAISMDALAEHHDQGVVNRHMHRQDFDKLVQHFEDPGRADWQKPELVIAALGELENQTVADIGAGSGYFTFPIAEKAAHVIAIDIDQRMLDYIDEKKAEQSVGGNIETRHTAPDHPGLAAGEADRVLIVNTYHHIEGRPAYLEKLAVGMRAGARLLIVDFFKRDLPVGPPPRMKLTPADVTAELSAAGFTDIAVDETSLSYQYLVTAVPPNR